MKILYFSPHPQLNLNSPAGYGSHMRGTINALIELGHDVKCFIAGGTEKELKQAKNSYVTKLIKKCVPSWLKETIKDYQLLKLDKIQGQRLMELMKEYQPDLVYERGYYLMTAGVKTSRNFGVKHMLEVNAPFIQEKIEMGGFSIYLKTAERIEKYKAQNTDSLVVVSTALKQHMVKNYTVDPKKILVCPNGINTQDWLPDLTKVNDLRSRYKYKNTDFVVGFVGSILPHHGVDELIHAFHQVAKMNWKLLIVGDGWPLNELKKQVEKLNIGNQVIFTGNVPFAEVKNYMSLFNVGVMPKSNWYGSPVKIFEYGAMGIPAIARNSGPVRDAVCEGVDSDLIFDSNELADALKQINTNLYEAMNKAKSWQKKVLFNYTWIANTTLTLSHH